LTLLVVMISSVQLLVLGLIGEYVGRIYIQSKNRPLFMISHIHRRGRLPHNAADGDDDVEKTAFKTLLAQSGPKARSPAYDEAT
jgi:dolichol-phosphate mannosyltransferase